MQIKFMFMENARTEFNYNLLSKGKRSSFIPVDEGVQ